MKNVRALLIAAVLACVASEAAGQSNPGFVYGQVPTAAQWNSYFSQKQDVLGFPPVNKNGDIMLGELRIVASSTGGAGINLLPGVAPTSPVNGDLWVTAAGLYVQINGSTVGPIGNVNTTSPFAINLNAAALISPRPGTIFQGQAADGNVARNELDAFGAIASFSGVIAAGTAASPTAVTANQQLTGINAYAYDGTSYDGPIASFRTYAAENITSSHNGSYACIATTLSGSTTSANQLCVNNDGGIVVGSPTGGDEGAGTINIPTAYYVNGSPIGLSAIAANSVLANFTAGSAVPIANAIGACGDATHALKYTAATGFGCQAITASATAGGSSGQVQWNNAAALGGVSGVTSNGTYLQFAASDLLLTGSSTGYTAFASANASATNYTLTFPAITDTVATLTAAQTFTGKTIDTASNTFKIAGVTITAITGNAATLASETGAITSGHCAQFDSNSNLVDAGAACGDSSTPGGATGNLQYNNGSGFGAVTNSNVSGSAIELGAVTAPTNSLTIASAGSGIKLFNTSAQVTNTEDAYMAWGTNVFTIGTEAAGTGSFRSMVISSVGTLTLSATSNIPFKVAGSTAATLYSNVFEGSANHSAFMVLNAAAGLTTPTVGPDQSSLTTGIGGGSGVLSLIASGTEVVHMTSTGTTFNTDVFTKGSTPTVTSCGAGPTIAAGSTDTAGKVTEGSSGGSTSCTVTFATVKAVAPFCTVSYGSGAGGTLAMSTSTTGVSIITGSAISSQTWFYICVNHS